LLTLNGLAAKFVNRNPVLLGPEICKPTNNPSTPRHGNQGSPHAHTSINQPITTNFPIRSISATSSYALLSVDHRTRRCVNPNFANTLPNPSPKTTFSELLLQSYLPSHTDEKANQKCNKALQIL
jgi:hypothetical protein